MGITLHYPAAVILAAGMGKRMGSDLPKVLLPLGGKPIVRYVYETLVKCGIADCFMVVGHHGDLVRQEFRNEAIQFVEQKEQRGTAHAVLETSKYWKENEGLLLVMNGDTPFVRPSTVTEFVEGHVKSGAAASVLTAIMEDPTGYGRIVRGSNEELEKIMEDRDASSAIKSIHEINAGIYCFTLHDFQSVLQDVTPQNAQGEYYITDTISIIRSRGGLVRAHCVSDAREVHGINTSKDLAEAEAILRMRGN